MFFNDIFGASPMPFVFIPVVCHWCVFNAFQDIIAGFLYSLLILVVFHPALDIIDTFNRTHPYAPLIIISLHVGLGLFSFTWTPGAPHAATAQILGSGAGIALASHINYHLGLARPTCIHVSSSTPIFRPQPDRTLCTPRCPRCHHSPGYQSSNEGSHYPARLLALRDSLRRCPEGQATHGGGAAISLYRLWNCGLNSLFLVPFLFARVGLL